jgi:pimeloyl-ACP methyl ester carboxylesterase
VWRSWSWCRTFLSTIEGPIVLVGHSYGGFVITNAATGNPNVRALVYIAAFAPAQGDTVQALQSMRPGAMLGPATLDVRPYRLPDGTQGLEGSIKPSVFREVFAADLPRKLTAIMAASQRPASLATLGEPSGPPAWEDIPSWYLVAGRDNAIGTANERIMAERINATTIEIKHASHVVMTSRPGKTTKLILRAVKGAEPQLPRRLGPARARRVSQTTVRARGRENEERDRESLTRCLRSQSSSRPRPWSAFGRRDDASGSPPSRTSPA